MKAAVLFKPNDPLQVVECELDPPKAGEVRVKMKAAGVCQSDWHIINGDDEASAVLAALTAVADAWADAMPAEPPRLVDASA